VETLENPFLIVVITITITLEQPLVQIAMFSPLEDEDKVSSILEEIENIYKQHLPCSSTNIRIEHI
jgi:hypothetical protein